MKNWLPIPGYEGLYEVSNDGEVRGVDRLDSAGRVWKGRLLGIPIDGSGYKKAILSKNGKAKGFLIHRLVLRAFVGEPPEGMIGCHNDGNRHNNDLSNLRWASLKDNWEDSRIHGNREPGYHSWLVPTDVERIDDLRASGASYAAIARWVGFDPATVRKVVNRVGHFSRYGAAMALS